MRFATSHFLALSSACLLTAVSASAQAVQFNDFSSTNGLTLLGSATQAGSNLRITNTVSNQTGNAWHTAPLQVLAGFDTQFEFQITAGPTLAEGMAIIISNDPSGPNRLGGSVWGLGYGTGANNSPVRNSLAIEVDTFLDGFLGDTSNNELSVHTGGSGPNDDVEAFSIGRVTPATNMSDGATHTMRVRYVPGTLEVYIDDLINPELVVPYDLQTGGTRLNGAPVGGLLLPTGEAFIGFGASTGAGGLTERVDILSWSFESLAGPDACFEGTVPSAGGMGPEAVLKINGSAGDFFRRETVFSADPWTIDIEQPSTAVGPTPVLLFGTLGAADGSSPLATPFGPLCFSTVSVLDFGVFAPASVPVPPGIPLLGELTLQGVISVDNTVSSALATTNAIILDFVAAPAPAIAATFPPSGAPGATIEIGGENFSEAATVAVNGMTVASTFVSRQAILFAMPAGLPCDSTVTVTNPDGQSTSAPFNPTPTVTSTFLSSGPAAGGGLFVIVGNGFGPGTMVTIGGAATTLNSASFSNLTMNVPPGTPGPAQVVITTLGGCTTTTTYTYL